MYLETERLIIRNWKLDDVPAYAEIVVDPAVMRYIRDGATQTYEQAEHFVFERFKELYGKNSVMYVLEPS